MLHNNNVTQFAVTLQLCLAYAESSIISLTIDSTTVQTCEVKLIDLKEDLSAFLITAVTLAFIQSLGTLLLSKDFLNIYNKGKLSLHSQ